MDSIRYLTVAQTMALYDEAMAESGQSPAPLVRENDLQRALHHPRTIGYYEGAGLAAQAVDLALEIALAHAWVDGNKRIAVFAFRVFLRLNGVSIPAGGAYLEFAKQIVATVGAKPEDRVEHVGRLVDMVQQWNDQSKDT
jgi:prophage maintenance system killer protein